MPPAHVKVLPRVYENLMPPPMMQDNHLRLAANGIEDELLLFAHRFLISVNAAYDVHGRRRIPIYGAK
jgi:hypothetical protein